MNPLKRRKPTKKGEDTTPRVKANTDDIIKAARESKHASLRLASVLERNHITVRLNSQLGGRTKGGNI